MFVGGLPRSQRTLSGTPYQHGCRLAAKLLNAKSYRKEQQEQHFLHCSRCLLPSFYYMRLTDLTLSEPHEDLMGKAGDCVALYQSA